MSRPISASINPAALRHNLQRVRLAAPNARVWAVVKANAYGHGIENVFHALRGADGFAVLEVPEARRLRALGWRGPILLMEGVFDARELEACSRLDLWHTVHCDAQIDWLAAHKSQTGQRVFLKMNTGMNRLGFPPPQWRSAWARLHALPQVQEVSAMTHFSDADQPAGTLAQRRVFTATAGDIFCGDVSLSNSAAILDGAHGAGAAAPAMTLDEDWVRAGIMLYGASPGYPAHSSTHYGLLPVMSLHSRILAVQHLQKGDSVGYGSTFVAEGPLRLGVVACGYADGYPRACGTGTPVAVQGVRTRLLGRVSMDMLCVDLTPVAQAGPGSEVLLWGQSQHYPSVTVPVDEVAAHAGTIGYELLCALAPRVPVKVLEPAR